MSYYTGEHSITFYVGSKEYNTWSSWKLIPSVKPTVIQPTPVYKYVDIPGRNGSLDLSTYLTGGLTYTDRKGTFDFYVDNNGRTSTAEMENIRSSIASVLSGQKVLAYLRDESTVNGTSYYYKGRVHLKEMQPGQDYSHVVLEYQFEPYRYYKRNNTEYTGGL